MFFIVKVNKRDIIRCISFWFIFNFFEIFGFLFNKILVLKFENNIFY